MEIGMYGRSLSVWCACTWQVGSHSFIICWVFSKRQSPASHVAEREMVRGWAFTEAECNHCRASCEGPWTWLKVDLQNHQLRQWLRFFLRT
jgi:hypothetical protein